ncbi:hypothetical protein RCZ04_19150 [Capnocytophaga sp. HP1101]
MKDFSFEELLAIAKTHYTQQLPLVLAKEPNTDCVLLLRQNDRAIYDYDTDSQKVGFLFVPFSAEKRILLKGDVLYGQLPKEANTTIAEKITIADSPKEKQKHIELVSKAIDEIHQGHFEKVVLSREITIKGKVNPFKSFTNIVTRYPSAFCYLWYHPKVGTWLAATPETLFRSNGEDFCTMALAGTQPFKEGEVHWELKECEEQQIVTDTIVQQLQGYVEGLEVSEPHTVRAGSVMHLCTEIKGKIALDKADDLVQRLHPTPAVCGYPTEEARTFILKNEPYDRQYYTGYCGWVSPNSQALYVNLRCMQITDTETYLYVGGGITKDSVPEKEYEETQNKAQTMKSVIIFEK